MNLATLLRTPSPAFTQAPFYEPITDSLLMYLRNERSYAKRISKHFTLFASTADDTLVGFEIKGVRDICKAIESDGFKQIVGPIGVKDEDGACELSVMVKVATMSNDLELNGDEYEELTRATRGRHFGVEPQQLC